MVIETHTRLIRKVKQAQIRLNLLIGLNGIKYKNHISRIESCQNSKYKTHTRLIRELKITNST